VRAPLGPVLALALLLALPHLAVAQVPPTPQAPLPGAASVDVKAAQATVTVSLDQATQVTITVTNTEMGTGNSQVDQPRFFAVTVAGMPDGWTASLSPPTFQLKPQESRQATLQVSVSGAAVDKQVRLTVTAKAYARGVNAVPVAGPTADPEALANTDVVAARADNPQRVLLETVGPYVWILLLALVAALVIILSLVAANRRVAVRLSAAEPQRTVAPGARAVFPVLVHNITRRDDTVVLRVANVPEGWATFLPTPQLDLEAGHQEEVPVVVIAPKEAAEGTRQPFTVQATSAQAPRRPATVALEAEVVAPRKGKAKEPAPESPS
jgi:hypothetical protein